MDPSSGDTGASEPSSTETSAEEPTVETEAAAADTSESATVETEAAAGDTTESAVVATAAAEGPPTTPARAQTSGWRRRQRGWVAILVAVATVIAVLAATTTWVKRQALSTDAWTTASRKLIENPDVQDALSTYIVDQLYSNVDVQQQLADRLPSNLQGLAGPITAALRQPTTDAVHNLLGTTRFQNLWVDVNRRAHQALVAVLEDNLRVMSTTNGVVTLNLGDLIRQVGQQVGLPSSVLDRIPADAGNVVLANSQQLANAQRAVRAIRVLSVWLFVLVVALYALAVYLAQGERRRTLRNVGWSLLGAGIVLLLVRRFTIGYVVSMVASPNLKPAARAATLIGSELLAQIAWAGITYAVVVLLGAIYAGPTRPATAVRRFFAPVFSTEGWVVWFGGAIVFGLLVLWSPTAAFASWWSALILFVLFMLGVEALRRQSVAEFPDATFDQVAATARQWYGSARGYVTSFRGRGSRPSTAAGAGAPSVEQLERLAHLHDSGALSDDEFMAAKQAIIGGAAAAEAG